MGTLQITSIAYFVIFFLILIAVSIWSSKKKAGSTVDAASEHFLAGKTTPIFVLAMSYAASSVSAGSFMGDPGMVSTVGYPYYWFAVFLVPGAVLPGLFIIRKMRLQCEKLGCMTAIEYLGKRYNSRLLQLFIGIVAVIAFTFMMIAQFKAAALLLEQFVGVPFKIALVIIGFAILFCTVMGGMRSVAYTDTLQGVLMIALCIVLISAGLVKAGGLGGADATLAASNPEMLNLFQSGVFADCGVPGVIGLFIFSFFVVFSQPYLTSRYMAMKDVTKKSVGKFLLITLFVGCLFQTMMLNGITGRAIFPTADADHLTVTMAAELLHPLIASGVMLGFFAAIISTATSVLLVVGQGAGRDIYSIIKKDASMESQLRVSNIACTIVVLVIIVFNIFKTPKLLQVFLLLGQTGVGSAICPALFAGVLWKQASKEGAIASAIVGALSTVVLTTMKVGMGIQMGLPVILAGITMIVVTLLVNSTKGVSQEMLELSRID